MNLIPNFVQRRISHRPNLIRIIDNIGWLLFDKILRMVVSLLVGVWVARYLGPAQFGLLNFATAFISLFGAIAGLGLQGIVVRDIVRSTKTAHLTLGTAAVLQLVGGLVAYGLMLGAIIWLYPDDTQTKVLVAILGAAMLFKASEIAVYWFESQVQSKYTVWVQNSVFLTFAAIKVVLILKHAPLVAFVWSLLAETILASLILIIVMDRCTNALANLKVTAGRAIGLLKESWPMIVSATAVLASMNVDRLFVMKFQGAAENGTFVAAQNLVQLSFFLPVVIGASITPKMVEIRKKNIYKYKKYFLYFYIAFGAGGLFISATTWLFSTEIVSILYGEKYHASSKILEITAWSIAFVFVASIRNKALVINGNSKMVAMTSIIGLLINIVLLSLFVPERGGAGAAYAFNLSWIINIALYPVLTRLKLVHRNDA